MHGSRLVRRLRTRQAQGLSVHAWDAEGDVLHERVGRIGHPDGLGKGEVGRADAPRHLPVTRALGDVGSELLAGREAHRGCDGGSSGVVR